MEVERKILEELRRFNQINKYILNEQDPAAPPADPAAPPADPAAPPADPAAPPVEDPAAAGAPPAAGATPPPAPPTGEPIDLSKDPDVEELPGDDEEGTEGEGETEELDITDLVDSQKTMADKQEEYFENLFNQIKTMEEKLAEMDNIVQKIDILDAKVERYRPKTPQEKLELRSLDSGPYKQNLADFFKDKEEEMEKTGKNEYELTSDDFEDFSPNEIK